MPREFMKMATGQLRQSVRQVRSMELSTTVHFDRALTQESLEDPYASARFPGDPNLVFEEITAVDWNVRLHSDHTLRMPPEEFKRYLRLRLHCRTD